MATITIIVAALNIGCAVLVGALAVPLIQRRIKMNHLYGVRFRKSFESDELWYELNEYGGRQLLTWSIILGLIGFASLFLPLQESETLAILLACAPVILGIPCYTTYRYSKTL